MKSKTDIFIQKSNLIHNHTYAYTNTTFKRSDIPVIISCSIHGDFLKTPSNHISGKQGCPKCSKKHRPTTQEFIRSAVKIHGQRYDYSKVNYINNKTKIVVGCSIHGNFCITPKDHINGSGCRMCANKNLGAYHKKNTNWFIQKSKNIHGNLYDYSNVKYKRYHDKVEILCSDHGPFYQTAGSHIHNKSGCPVCAAENTLGGYGEQRFKNYPELKHKSGCLYIITMTHKHNGEQFIKVGITCSPLNKRLTQLKKTYDISDINTKEGNLYEMFKQEQLLKQEFAKFKFRPQHKFSGHTECFTLESRPALIGKML